MEEYEAYKGKYHTITLPSGFYGGSLVINKDGTGVLTSAWANIASYDGETLPGRWVSDRDAYTEGATPTIGAQVVYELTAPIEIPVNVEQVKSVLGLNNLFVVPLDDTTISIKEAVYQTDHTVNYDVQDLKDTIPVMISNVEHPIATTNHTVGDLFICNNKLCKATSSIAIGDAIVENTNVEYTTIEEQLVLLNTMFSTIVNGTGASF